MPAQIDFIIRIKKISNAYILSEMSTNNYEEIVTSFPTLEEVQSKLHELIDGAALEPRLVQPPKKEFE